jgi:hypothetical protein
VKKRVVEKGKRWLGGKECVSFVGFVFGVKGLGWERGV